MKLDKFVLAQNMAFLGSIVSESNLAKLLAFCLATKDIADWQGFMEGAINTGEAAAAQILSSILKTA